MHYLIVFEAIVSKMSKEISLKSFKSEKLKAVMYHLDPKSWKPEALPNYTHPQFAKNTRQNKKKQQKVQFISQSPF